MGMNFDDASNEIFLPIPDTNVSGLSRHRGYHSTYNTFVKNQLDAIDINQPLSMYSTANNGFAKSTKNPSTE
ncbi:AHH domain-containing protein [Streptococcus suis]|uniref:AHH domain-containing protein n=1 Tax=Streptococcus suis TaxID=1307 RepID=UPI0039BDD759